MTGGEAARLRAQLERMRALARSPQLHARSERVSGWSVGEHLDHMARVSMSVLRRLAQESVEPAPKGINLMGRLLLALRWIPRGLGKAPSRFHAVPCTAAEIEESLTALERAFGALPPGALSRTRGPIVPHPRFGPLDPEQALRFVVVHHDHHLKIVDDVLSAQQRLSS